MEHNEIEQGGIEWNEMEWSGMKVFHWLDILEMIWTNFAFYHLSLKLEGNKIESKWWYEMKFISFHYYLSNPNSETLFYSIIFHSISFHQSKHSLSFILLHTLQIVRKENLKDWMVWDGMSSSYSISLHSYFLQIQTMECNYLPLHFIPFNHLPSIQT
jgi:hypothetical protein